MYEKFNENNLALHVVFVFMWLPIRQSMVDNEGGHGGETDVAFFYINSSILRVHISIETQTQNKL